MGAFNVMVATASEDICDDVTLHARDIAAATGENEQAAHAALVALIKKSLHASRPDVADARSALWRVRIQLVPTIEGGTVEADTDPELPDWDAPGSVIVRGLPALATELRSMCETFHAGRDIQGLGDETLRHSIKAFRPTLSRYGGNAWWRPKYVLLAAASVEVSQPTFGSLKGVRSPIGGPRGKEFWSARVHVVRIDEAA